jgi:ribosomal protein S18 acetylase RimI-like enzyme
MRRHKRAAFARPPEAAIGLRMDIELRPARTEDADAAVPLMYSSGPAVTEYIFACDKGDMFACMKRGFERDAGELGYAVHTVAVVDNAVVGIGAGFAGDAPLRFLALGALNILACRGVVQSAGMVRRALQIERMIRPPKRHEQCVAHLGVAPAFRGKGIGALIVRHLLDEGRRLGRRTAVLDVSVENPRAQALYERLGFAVTRECISTLRNRHATVPSHRRMELAL